MRLNINHTILLFVLFTFSSCSFGKKIKSGEMAYERKQYAVAVDLLQNELSNDENVRNRGRLSFLLGKSYSYLEEQELAVEWLAKSVDFGYGNDALSALAKGYKKTGNYPAAIKTYELLKNSSNTKRQIDREIYVLKEVSKWKDKREPGVEVLLLNENTAFSEYTPVVLDKNFLVFTSDREESSGSESYNWTGNKHSDIFVMLKNGSDVRRFDAGINSDHNEGTACFTQDGLEMIFSRCFVSGESDGYCRLMYSHRFSGIWSEPTELPMQKSDVNYGHPTFIENDSVLVFSAWMEGGAGGHDLYYTERTGLEGGGSSWSEINIFPNTVNSQGNEMFPSGDGDTLYFSSDYYAGLGGLDIFKTWLQPNGQWAPPQNMKRPINSSFDDFSFSVDRNAQLRGDEITKGFFTSTRNGYGKEDLYKFEITKTKEEIDSTLIPLEDMVSVDIYLAGKTSEIEYDDPTNPNSQKLGKVNLAKSYITISDGETSRNVYSDDKGQFIFDLELDKEYIIKASKIGYLNSFESVSTKNLDIKKGELSKTINIELVLNKIYSNVEITLENIYYNFNKYNIRKDAEPTLDSLSTLLQENPQINIQLSSHTDCRGDDEFNQILSQKRAESAVEYIISKGISRDRLTARGYGKSIPNINCDCDSCTEEEHQANRRTTFKILE